LQFPVIRVVWKRIETLQSVSLCCGLVECLLGLAPNAPSPVKQCGAEQDANSRNNEKRSERAILLKPFHAAKLFFTIEDAEITEVIIRRLHRFTQIWHSDFGHSFVIRHSRFVICDHPWNPWSPLFMAFSRVFVA
jgi:hypothetical protein